jgi:hypothetical protein
LPRGVREIDVQYVGQLDQVDEHVRQFFADSRTERVRRGTSYRLIGR